MGAVNTLSDLIGRNLRRYRALRGLPAFELAQRSGIARATLSALEAGRGNPTLDTLAAVAGVLGVDVVDLMEAESRAMTIARAGDDLGGDAGSPARLLRRFRAGPCSIDLYTLVLAAGDSRASEAHDPGVLEHVLVHTGELDLELDPDGGAPKRARLTPGDYASFTADVPHVYTTNGAEVRATVILHYAAGPTPKAASETATVASDHEDRAPTGVGDLTS
jgi:transcriptional regulator with XRE-family HTH domain